MEDQAGIMTSLISTGDLGFTVVTGITNTGICGSYMAPNAPPTKSWTG